MSTTVVGSLALARRRLFDTACPKRSKICEGAYPAYAYEKLHLTADFSRNFGNNLRLGATPALSKRHPLTGVPADYTPSLSEYFQRRWGEPTGAVAGPGCATDRGGVRQISQIAE